MWSKYFQPVSCTRAARKLCSNFEYLENRSSGNWCNLAASQRRHYCTSRESHSPVGLVSRQWETVDWACVLCDRHIHNDRASRSASSRQCACPFYSSRAGFFLQSVTSPKSVSPPTAQIWLPATSGFSQN